MDRHTGTVVDPSMAVGLLSVPFSRIFSTHLSPADEDRPTRTDIDWSEPIVGCLFWSTNELLLRLTCLCFTYYRIFYNMFYLAL